MNAAVFIKSFKFKFRLNFALLMSVTRSVFWGSQFYPYHFISLNFEKYVIFGKKQSSQSVIKLLTSFRSARMSDFCSLLCLLVLSHVTCLSVNNRESRNVLSNMALTPQLQIQKSHVDINLSLKSLAKVYSKITR